MRKTLLGLAGGLLTCAATAQTSPFVDPKVEQALVNELSGDRLTERALVASALNVDQARMKEVRT